MDRFVIRQTKPPARTIIPEPSEPLKRKTRVAVNADYDSKKRKRLLDFKWLRQELDPENGIQGEAKGYCFICRQFPTYADKNSGLFEGMVLKRRDTLSAHNQSTKHVLCQTKYDQKNGKKVTGKIDVAFAKVDQSEVERYNKLFNTAYAIAKGNKPYSDYPLYCELQTKNWLNLGSDHIGRDACVDFIKAISLNMLEEESNTIKEARFLSVMSDSSTDSSVIDQEVILLRYVHPSTADVMTSYTSIEGLQNSRAEGVFEAIKFGVSKVGVDIENMDPELKLVCVNMDGAAVNMGAKSGVAKKINDVVENNVLVTHCVAHKLELGVLDAVKEVSYLDKFEKSLKRICKFYTGSPKRRGDLQSLAAVLDEMLLMHSEIRSVRWVSSKVRALKAVCVDLPVTVTHMEQVLSESNRANELGDAKAILTDLQSLTFVKYVYFMLDILLAVTAASKLFQTKDLLIFEVKEGIDTLLSSLLAMKAQPGENLQKFFDSYNTSTHMLDNKVKLNGELIQFAEDNDVQGLLDKVSSYISKRFADLNKAPLSLFSIFDFRVWPHRLTELSVYGNAEIKQLCGHFSDVLTEEECSKIPEQWQTLKVKASLQRMNHPLGVYQDMVKRCEGTIVQITALLRLMMTVSPSTAACERAFSQMNLCKTSHRSCLTQDNLQHQLRIVIDGPELAKFDPVSSVLYWLKSGNRHITHQKPKKAITAVTESDPSSSAETELVGRETLNQLKDVVKLLGGEEAAVQK